MNEEVSKSQKKRQADALQKLGMQLVDLNPDQLKTLSLTDNLYQAIVDAKTIKSHGAKRRQAQLIGKLMRSADFEAIACAYQKIQLEDSSVTAHFHEIETWRDKLISQGKPALTEFINFHQPENIQKLQQLIKKAIQDQSQERNTGAAKALFRYLRLNIK